ncbi:Putative BET1-like protein [Septoria linicola]|uniref:BET1-like protein n=1 Tax=Septoria linicola TaxID=215465 RepID=A0A9Q9AQL9_9PEZI|nr:Putative BET1-like protein [Septoria linicola]
MASRFARQNDARNALFSNYDASQNRSRPSSAASNNTPQRSSSRNPPYQASPSPYALNGAANDNFAPAGGAVYGAYNASSSTAGSSPYGVTDKKNDDAGLGFRSATPDKKGRYSDSVLESLESQNDDQAGEMSKKVKMLKELTMAIGDEIRDSTKLADSMNDSFEGARNRLRGTMNKMLRMAERTGVGWKVWVLFFIFIWCLFAYVWLF